MQFMYKYVYYNIFKIIFKPKNNCSKESNGWSQDGGGVAC